MFCLLKFSTLRLSDSPINRFKKQHQVLPTDSKELGDVVKEQFGILPADEGPVRFQGSHDRFLEDFDERPQAAVVILLARY